MKIKIPYLIFEATQLCNLNCRYCYNPWKRPGGKAGRGASYHQAKKTMRRLFRSAKINHIAFSGGEPLLLDGIEELILYCRLKKKSVTIITNGTTTKYGQYATLVDLGVSLFVLPVHSESAAQHDFMTRCKGSWKSVIRSAELLLSADAKIAISIVLCASNINSLKNTLKFIKDLGINKIMLNRFNIGGEGINQEKNLIVTAGQLHLAFREANALAYSMGLDITSNVCTPHCIIDPLEFPHLDYASCVAGTTKGPLTIDAFGFVRICNHSPYFLGNIHDNKILNIISSKYAQKWQSSIPDECEMCQSAQRCRGGCRAAAEQCGLTIESPDPLLKVAYGKNHVAESERIY